MAFNPNFRCPLCVRFHAVRQCSRFVTLPPEEKLEVVALHALCENCLAHSHTRAACGSIDRCRRCLQQHHSWLHPMPEGRVWVKMTAAVRIRARSGGEVFWSQALLDPTVARSSIMLDEARGLGCRVVQGRTTVTVFHGVADRDKFEVEVTVEERPFGRSPAARVKKGPRIEGNGAPANPQWSFPGLYYLILGADVAPRIYIGPAKGRPGTLLAQDTIFGVAYFGEGVTWNQ